MLSTFSLFTAVVLMTSSALAGSGAVWKPLYKPIEANKEVVSRPGKTSIVSPEWYAQVAAPATKLEWSEAERSTGYHVQVATDPNFKWLVQEQQYVKGTSLEVSGLEAGKQYYWRVAGMNEKNEPNYIKGDYARSMFVAK